MTFPIHSHRLTRCFPFVWFLIIVVFLVLITGVIIPDGDIWMHLAFGKIIASIRYIPQKEFFSHTLLGNPITLYEWGSQILFYIIYNNFDVSGLILLRVGISLVVFCFFWASLREYKTHFILQSFLILVLSYFYSRRPYIRPEMFTVLFFTITLYLVEASRRKEILSKSSFCLLIGILLIWQNVHLGFPVYFILLFTYISGIALGGIIGLSIPKKYLVNLLLLFVVSGLSLGFNPYGYNILSPFMEHAMEIKDSSAYISEWQSVTIKYYAFWIMISCSIIISLRKVNVQRNYNALLDCILVLVFSYFGYYIVRNVHLSAIVCLVIIGKSLTPENMMFNKYKMWVFIMLFAFQVIFLILVSQKALRYSFNKETLYTNRPASVVAFFLKNDLKGKLFNSYEDGGFLSYFLYPQCNVFMDSRNIFISYLKKIFHFDSEDEFNNWLIKNDVDIAIIKKGKYKINTLPIIYWDKIFTDNHYIVFKRRVDKGAGNRQL